MAPAAAEAAQAGQQQLTGRILVSTRPAQGTHARAAAMAVIASTGARLDGPSVPEIHMLTVAPPPGTALDALLGRLRADPLVQNATPDRRFTLRYVPNDPALTTPEAAPGTPPGTPVEWWPFRENLPAAWDISRGDGAKVAVIDTGIDAAHPEFQGKIDYTNSTDANSGDGPATTDQDGHGTHVAGLACAGSNNGVGLAGAGLDCHLLVEKTDFSEASVIASIVDATKHGAQAINMSFGTDGSTPAPPQLATALNYAYDHNVVLVAAAADSPVQEQGDPANVLQPAGSGPNFFAGRGLVVTSADFDGQRSSFAGYGSEISMAAEGAYAESGGPRGIFSTFPANLTKLDLGSVAPVQSPCACRVLFQGDDRYAYLEGTSMAAPQVAAIAALIRQLNPDLSAADVIEVLKASAQRSPGSLWTADLGWGILDGGAALKLAQRIDLRPPTSTVTAPKHTRAPTVTLTISGSDPAPPGLVAPGIDHYEVYRTVDDGKAARIATTAASSLVTDVSPGHLYGWYSLAVDRAGNRQPAPTLVVHTRTPSTARSRALRARTRSHHRARSRASA